MTETILELDAKAMSETATIRTIGLAAKLSELIVDSGAIFAQDYTIVPIEDGVVVSKQSGDFFYDVRVQSGKIQGINKKPRGFVRVNELSDKRCGGIIAGALAAIGCSIDTPPEHNLQIE